MFNNRYYATGRHHSAILGISIPDYLDLIGIDDNSKYRIFVNNNFCRVMKEDTDALISFFGHEALDKIKLSIDPIGVQIDKICPICGNTMEFKQGKFGAFLGCSNYPNCKKTIRIPFIGNI